MHIYPLVPALLLWSVPAAGAEPCSPAVVKVSAPSEIRAFFDARRLQALTFMGFSGAEYEDPAAMLALAGRTLDKYSPQKTIVLIGATREGIGAVYELAKSRGFATAGIVSSQAKANNVQFSPVRRSCLRRRRRDMGWARPEDAAAFADIRRDGGEQRHHGGDRWRRRRSRRVDRRPACGQADRIPRRRHESQDCRRAREETR